jgi:hypothetical protein
VIGGLALEGRAAAAMVAIFEVILSLITRGLDFIAAARTGEVLELSGQTFSSAISWTPNQGPRFFFSPGLF